METTANNITITGAAEMRAASLAAGPAPSASKLSAMLRKLGAAVLLVSALTFLVQRWDGLAHVERYYSFLGYTLLLGVAGFFCGLRMRDDKGARTFLAIAAATVPVHFCQLGAFLYYRVLMRTSDAAAIAAHYPSFAHLTVASDLIAAFAVGAGLVLLVPTIFVSFSALLRSEAKRLTAAYTLANMALLIPVREPGWVAVIAGALLLAVTRFDLAVLRKASGIRTKEGRFVRLMLAAPVVIMIVRTLLYYASITYVFGSAVLAIISTFLYAYAPSYTENEESGAALQQFGILFALGSWLNLSIGICRDLHIDLDTALLLHSLPMSVIIGVLSFGLRRGADKARSVAAALAGVTAIADLMMFPGLGASLVCLAVSIPVAAIGVISERKKTFVLGILGSGYALFHHVRIAIVELGPINPWIGLALLGTATLLASSYIERHQDELKARLGEVRRRFASLN